MLLIIESIGVFVGALAFIGTLCLVELRLSEGRGFGNAERA